MNADRGAAADAPARTTRGRPSLLDDTALAHLRAQTAKAASPFIDPRLLRDATTLLPGAGQDWLCRVIGHPVPSIAALTNQELSLAVQAARVDAVHLQSLAAQRRAAAAQEQQHARAAAAEARLAQAGEWHRLRARLPVPVAVQHNWTARHVEGYEQGADHIVVLQDLAAGRLHRRTGQPLCWTPSRGHQLRHVSGNVGDGQRLPTCRACLHHAETLASSTAGKAASRLTGGMTPRIEQLLASGPPGPEPMRALTVRQPWAACIAHLDKRVENRRWACWSQFIGARIALHAGASLDRAIIQVPDGEAWATLFASTAEWDAYRFWHLGGKTRDVANWPPKLALSAVVAVATIAGCHLSDPAEGCGDGTYAHGVICSPWAAPDQYHWALSAVHALPSPVLCKGNRGLWPLPESVEKAVRAQLRLAA
jgi:hypothetical protein